jgi:hypothetical protein
MSGSTFPTTLVLVSRCICSSYILTSSSVIPCHSSIQANACLCPRSKTSRILWNQDDKVSYLLQPEGASGIYTVAILQCSSWDQYHEGLQVMSAGSLKTWATDPLHSNRMVTEEIYA